MENLEYSELKLQSYLELKELTVEDSKMLLLWRLRMAKFGANYGETTKQCPLCKKHKDCQETSFNRCEEIRKKVEITFQYEDIFSKPTSKVAKVLKEIMNIRENQ